MLVSPVGHFRQHSQVRNKLTNAVLMYYGKTNDTQLLSFTYFYKAGDDPIGSKYIAAAL
jgi:hypothetical protein